MDKSELYKILYPNKKQPTKIFIPNEFFNEIRDCIKKGKIKNGKHAAFIYCYYCLICYLYRYARYGSEVRFTQALIKEILGYNKDYKLLNYLIKKNGVLDQIQYTETTYEYPISWGMVDEKFPYFVTNFSLQDQNDEFRGKFPQLQIKRPIRGFYRYLDDYEIEDEYSGTFYNIESTHHFNIKFFIEAMQNPAIGTIGFYLYQFINRGENHKINMAFKGFEKILGIKEDSISKYLGALEQYGFIRVIRRNYVINAPIKNRKPNTYLANQQIDEILSVPKEREVRRVYYHHEGDSNKNDRDFDIPFS